METEHTTDSALSELPDELWLECFSWIDLKHLLTSTLVCKNWKRLLTDDAIWNDIYQKKWNEKPTSNRLFIRTLHIRRSRITQKWNTGTPKLITTLAGHKDKVHCVQINSSLNRIVSGSQDKTVKIWDILKKTCIATIKGAWGGIETVQFNSSILVSGTNHRDISAYDMQSLQRTRRFKGHLSSVYSIKMNEQGFLVSASRDQTVKLWDMRVKDCIKSFTGHTDSVVDVEFVGNKIYSVGCDSTLKEWDITTGKLVKNYTHHKKSVNCVEYLKDKNCIVTGGDAGVICFLDLNTGLIESVQENNMIVSLKAINMGIVYNMGNSAGVRTEASQYNFKYKLPYIEPANPSIAWIGDLDVDVEQRRVVGASTTGVVYLWDFL